MTFPSGDTTLVVEAIFSGATDWVGSMFVDLDALTANGGDALDYRVYVSGDEAAISHVADPPTPPPTCWTRTASSLSSSSEIDTMLGLFYALLMLAVVIALLGIANTLALSIFERTRELGLLRAVGMGRSQVRSTVRWESITRPVRTRLGVVAEEAMMIDSQRTVDRTCDRLMPTARSRPSSRVRSKIDSAKVLAMPSRAMTTASISRA